MHSSSPPICVSSVENGFMLSGYDYPCHPNLENICVHISAYLHTHPGMSQDMVEEDTHKWTHTVKPANTQALCTCTH